MYRLLLVEDDALILMSTSICLKEKSFVCDTAKNGLDALEKIEKNVYDLILLDISMPRKNGYEVLSELRMAGNKTPVVMLTGDTEESSKIKCLEAGADAYITKPYLNEDLIIRINKILSNKDKTVSSS